MSFVERETFVTVPAVLLESNKGIGIDFGRSGVKFVYVAKEDIDEEQKSKDSLPSYRKLRAVTFGRDELADAARYVKQRTAFLSESSVDTTTVYATGVGGMQVGKTTGDLLNVRLDVASENESVVDAVCFLVSELPRRHFVEARDERAVSEAIGRSITMARLLGGAVDAIGGSHDSESLDPQQQLRQTLTKKTGYVQYGSDDETGDKTLIASEPGLYPFIVVNCGSFTFTAKVTSSSSRQILGMSSSGGRAMLGQANKLIGVKTYEELVNLASTGNSFNVSETFGDLLFTDRPTDDSQDNLYANAFTIEGTDKVEVYAFSRLVGRDNIDNFRREDIASAWLDRCVEDLVRTVQLDSCKSGIRRVFFTGGMLTHPYVRHVLTREMIKKNVADYVLYQAEPVLFDLIKGAPYTTAVGCLVRDHKARAEQVPATDIPK